MRVLGSVVTACSVALACLVAMGCSSEPICGDGTPNLELGEQCDDGNRDETDICLNDCTLRPIPQLTLKWEFNQDLDRGFQGDSCFDVGAETVDVRLVGPGIDQTDQLACSMRQVRYQDIPAGSYSAQISVADSDGGALLSAPHSQDLIFSSGVDEEEILIVPPTQWRMAYTGSFFFRLGWGMMGDSCELSAPPVIDNSLLLRVGGTPFAGQTDVGHPVDGSAFSMCRPLSEGGAQAVLNVPFGPAQFTIQGRDGAGVTTFEETFETFVGAGLNNPELRFNVSILPGLDAGADASVDAM